MANDLPVAVRLDVYWSLHFMWKFDRREGYDLEGTLQVDGICVGTEFHNVILNEALRIVQVICLIYRGHP